jgi:hypothetical protein
MRAEVTGFGAELMARRSCQRLSYMSHQLRTVTCTVFFVNSMANESKG